MIEMKRLISISTMARIGTAFLLFYSLKRHPYDYYIVLRWVTFGVCSYSAFIAWRSEKIGWVWTLGLVAAVFNPVIPIHLKRETWAYIDAAAACLILISIYFVPERKQLQPESGRTLHKE
jgi:hypothetical protein